MVLQGWDFNSSSTTNATPLFLSHGWWQVTVSVWGPYVSHQDGVCLDSFKYFTACQPFQLLIISIMNGWIRWRLLYVLYNGNHNVVFSHGRGQSWLACIPLLTPRFSKFGLIWAIHSISTRPFSDHEYNEWFCKVEIWVHHPQPTTNPYFWVMGGDNFGIWGPYVSHHDGVCLDSFKYFTACQPFQLLIISIMNRWIRWRLLYVLYNMVTTTWFSVTGGVKVGLPAFHFWHQDSV